MLNVYVVSPTRIFWWKTYVITTDCC